MTTMDPHTPASPSAASPARPDLTAFERALRAQVRGEVSFDPLTRGLHSTDASHYQIMPACVVWPVDRDDAATAVRIAGEHDIPITPRGGATSLSGQTTWTGMVLDLSRHMDQLLELNVAEQWARVGPGMIRDQLNKIAAPHGLHFAPDPATGDRATVGGMVGNNSSGTHSIVHGKTSEHVLEAVVALADGSVLTLGPTDAAQWSEREQLGGREGEIHQQFRQIIAEHRQEILDRFPNVMRRVSGYSLDAFVHDINEQPWNLAHLIVGSEGTLGVLLEVKVRLAPLPKAASLCIVHFADLLDSLKAVEPILEHNPAAVEILDQQILSEAGHNRATARIAADFIEGQPAAVLITEFFGDSEQQVADKAQRLAAELQSQGRGYAWPVRTEPARQQRVWQLRKLALGLASNVAGPRKRQAFIEDACVPVQVLPQYIGKILDLCRESDTPVSLYGHASVGVIHVEPMLDLHLPSERQKMQHISEQVFNLVCHYGGSWSGEHGDGIVRGQYLQRFFGEQIYQAFRQVKNLFDPRNLMNPGKIIDTPGMLEHLRYGNDYRITQTPGHFHYREQGGFALAVEQCNGVGACRKLDAGTMCPSYMATRDEEHSTRGRANALRLAMSNQLGEANLESDRIHEALDLCLSCKACKSECPNSVDMSRLKSDVMQMHHDAHGTPLGTRLLGSFARIAPLIAGPLAPIVNWTQNLAPVKWLFWKVAGVDTRRTMPDFARRSLRKWFDKRPPATAPTAERPRVVLFDDTFHNYFDAAVGQAAVELLEACGYQVILARAGCCQRTRISAGLVRDAKRDGEKTLRALDAYARQGLPILTLEPSCASALGEDLPDLIDDEQLGKRVAAAVKMIDVFLAEQLQAGKLDVQFTSPFAGVLLHGHCHQKALFGTEAMKQVLSRIESLDVAEVDAGCCGMAGAFGYQKYDLSMKIGEDRLFPAVRDRGERAVIACGFSCRHQVHDGCDTQPIHWVQALRAQPADKH